MQPAQRSPQPDSRSGPGGEGGVARRVVFATELRTCAYLELDGQQSRWAERCWQSVLDILFVWSPLVPAYLTTTYLHSYLPTYYQLRTYIQVNLRNSHSRDVNEQVLLFAVAAMQIYTTTKSKHVYYSARGGTCFFDNMSKVQETHLPP